MLTNSQMNEREIIIRLSEKRVFALSDSKEIFPPQLFHDLSQTAQRLHQSKGDVLLICRGRYEFSVALIASWLAGKNVILPPNLHPEMLDHIRKEHDIATELNDGFTESDDLLLTENTQASYEIRFNNRQQAVTIYTSGSTGKPKPIIKSIGDLFAEVFALKNRLSWPDKPLVASVPPHHLYGLTFSILLPWVLGIAMVDKCPLHAEEVVDALNRAEAGTLITVPVHLRSLLEQKISCGPVIVISSAGTLERSIAEQWFETTGRQIVEIYGSSETGIIAHRKQLNENLWTPFPEVQISSNNQDLLRVSSPFINSSEENPFQTQDMVSMKGTSGFLLQGRVDSIVKIAGKRVSLLAVEEAIKGCRGVLDAAVTAVPVQGHIRDMAIWAAVATDDQSSTNARSLRTQLIPLLDGIEIPRRIVMLSKLPRTDNGKLRRQDMMALFQQNVQT